MNEKFNSKIIEMKCVAVGNGGNGKTCLLIRFDQDQFPEEWYNNRTNIEKNMDVNGTQVNLSLWDTAGGEEYDRLRPLCHPKN